MDKIEALQGRASACKSQVTYAGNEDGIKTTKAPPRAPSLLYQLKGLSEKGEEKGLEGLLSPFFLLGGWGGAEVIMTREMELSSSMRITAGLTYLLFFLFTD